MSGGCCPSVRLTGMALLTMESYQAGPGGLRRHRTVTNTPAVEPVNDGLMGYEDIETPTKLPHTPFPGPHNQVLAICEHVSQRSGPNK
mmetsp:Transcript_18934/g.27155  ORF Transcript_18934/g.27155 Transcript_18934/m.27155 type:complete len:88 (-) Transcript_18934:1888-2151(-)